MKQAKLEFSPEVRWQIRPVRASPTREKLNAFSMLDIEKIACSDLIRILYLGNCAITMLLIRPHRKWLCYFVPCGHGKLDLRFVHGKAEKCIEMVHRSRPKSPRKIIYHEFWRNRFAYLQTHLLM